MERLHPKDSHLISPMPCHERQKLYCSIYYKLILLESIVLESVFVTSRISDNSLNPVRNSRANGSFCNYFFLFIIKKNFISDDVLKGTQFQSGGASELSPSDLQHLKLSNVCFNHELYVVLLQPERLQITGHIIHCNLGFVFAFFEYLACRMEVE